MSSEASSKQLCVCEEAGYDEVYPSCQDDLDSSYSEKVLSTNSPSEEEDEDSDMDRSKSDTNGDSDGERTLRTLNLLLDLPLALTVLGSSFFPSCGRSTILIRPFKENT